MESNYSSYSSFLQGYLEYILIVINTIALLITILAFYNILRPMLPAQTVKHRSSIKSREMDQETSNDRSKPRSHPTAASTSPTTSPRRNFKPNTFLIISQVLLLCFHLTIITSCSISISFISSQKSEHFGTPIILFIKSLMMILADIIILSFVTFLLSLLTKFASVSNFTRMPLKTWILNERVQKTVFWTLCSLLVFLHLIVLLVLVGDPFGCRFATFYVYSQDILLAVLLANTCMGLIILFGLDNVISDLRSQNSGVSHKTILSNVKKLKYACLSAVAVTIVIVIDLALDSLYSNKEYHDPSNLYPLSDEPASFKGVPFSIYSMLASGLGVFVSIPFVIKL